MTFNKMYTLFAILLFALIGGPNLITAQTKSTVSEISTQTKYPAITHEQAFIYYLKANKIKPEEIAKNTKFQSFDKTWLIGYLETFESGEYQLAKNDEFKINSLKKTTCEKINNKINSYSFDAIFEESKFGYNEIGEYDFNTSSFPVKIKQIGTTFPLEFMGRNSFLGCVSLGVYKFKNLNSFDLRLAMPQDEAKIFIEAQKDQNGNIDRKVLLKIAYKISDLPQPASDQKELTGEIISIDVWAKMKGKFQKIGTLNKNQ